MDRICLRQKKNASVCCIVTTSSTLIMSMPHGLVVRRDWLPRLLAGEVAYVVKASKTMRRGTVYLVESGTGRVAAAATLTDVRQFNSAEKASPILREECGEPALHFAYGWFSLISNKTQTSRLCRLLLAAVARRGCPRRSWLGKSQPPSNVPLLPGALGRRDFPESPEATKGQASCSQSSSSERCPELQARKREEGLAGCQPITLLQPCSEMAPAVGNKA